jgi:hypothetical protein
VVVITERLPDAPSVEELERLWDAPAFAPSRPSRFAPIVPWLPRLLAFGWLATMVTLIGFEPSSSGITPPLWAELVVTAFFLVLAASGLAALARHRGIALWASLGAAGLGIVLGWSCRATAHHMGSWWLAEVAIFASLFALTAASLLTRRR